MNDTDLIGDGQLHFITVTFLLLLPVIDSYSYNNDWYIVTIDMPSCFRDST